MKVGQTQTEIAQILGSHKSTISRELARGSGRRGYRPRQAQNLSDKRSQSSRNAAHADERILIQMHSLLSMQWSPEQIASQLPISHETIYQQVYADEAMGGHVWCSLRCQNNGLLRQYIPKKCHLCTVTDAELKTIEDLLNHRPKKDWNSKSHIRCCMNL